MLYLSWQMQIHYDRVGKDGLFSHKEVTVLFVPDLSECLPSLEAWRDQWLAHKKDVAGREQQVALKKEVCGYIVWKYSFVGCYAEIICQENIVHTHRNRNL